MFRNAIVFLIALMSTATFTIGSGSATVDGSVGTVGWTNASNAEGAADGSLATSALLAGQQTKYLVGANDNNNDFDFTAIAEGWKVVGVTMVVRAVESFGVGVMTDTSVKLYDINNQLVMGSEKGGTKTLTGSLANYTYGGVSDLWGNAAADLKDMLTNGSFGPAISYSASVAVGTAAIDAVTFTVTYHEAPVVDTTNSTLVHPPTPGQQTIDSGLTVTSADSTTATVAIITINSNYLATEDVLAGGSDAGGVVIADDAVWDSGAGTLTITAHAPTTIAEWQTILSTVTYENTESNRNTKKRQVTFSLNDGVAIGTATRDIIVQTATIVRSAVVTATTGASTAGIGTIAWTNPGNVEGVSDASNATAALTAAQVTRYLTGLFPTDTIADDDTVVGIRVTSLAKRTSGTGTITDTSARLYKGSTTALVGTEKASGAHTLGASYSVLKYGAYNDLHGMDVGDLHDLLMAGDLGFAFSVTDATAAATVGVDSFLIEVFVQPAIIITDYSPVGSDNMDGFAITANLGKVSDNTGETVSVLEHAWLTPEAIEPPVNSSATVALTNTQESDRLVGRFRYIAGDSIPLLPTGKTVVGITVLLTCSQTASASGNVDIIEMQLWDNLARDVIGDNKGEQTFFDEDGATLHFGAFTGQADLWGVSASALGTLIQAGNLGFSLRVECGGSATGSVQDVSMIVQFTNPTGEPAMQKILFPAIKVAYLDDDE